MTEGIDKPIDSIVSNIATNSTAVLIKIDTLRRLVEYTKETEQAIMRVMTSDTTQTPGDMHHLAVALSSTAYTIGALSYYIGDITDVGRENTREGST